MLKSYVAFDLETTGLSPGKNEIIEIGAIKVRDGKVRDRFMEFIKPRIPIPSNITDLTGIKNEMVSSAGSCEEVLPQFLEFCENDILIGHNVLFDYSFVKLSAEALGYSFDKTGIDTLTIARSVHKDLPSKSLGFLCEYYQIQNTAAHRAYHDALATAKLYQTLAHYFEEKEPRIFSPLPLACNIKKRTPATQRQLDFLSRLTKEKGITKELNLKSLSRNEASRLIDRILSGQEI